MSVKSQFYIFEPQSLALPTDFAYKRVPPRARDKQQQDYTDRFDYQTLFYDAFVAESGSVVLSGPPMLNLSSILEEAVWTIGGASVRADLSDLDRTQHSRINGHYVPGDLLTLEVGSEILSTVLDRSNTEIFEGKHVLMTKSKDNELSWIRDWAQFHSSRHGFDAILFYDNGSNGYTPRDILEAIQSVSGIDTAVVVSWPFKFGPQGGNYGGVSNAPWDSDFCEYSILEHARYRFLTDAAYVSNHDIDELIVTADGRSIFEHVDESETGAIRYKGQWIESVGATNTGIASFTDYIFFDVHRRLGSTKWTATGSSMRKARQWSTHNIRGIPMRDVADVCHRHFVAISNSWKYSRRGRSTLDHKRHARDRELIRDFRVAFECIQSGTYNDLSPADLAGYYKSSLRTLCEISEVLTTWEGFTKHWFYRQNVAVYEYMVSGRGGPISIAFDLVAGVNGVAVHAVLRPPADARASEVLSAQFSLLGDDHDKFYLTDLSWTAGLTLIATDVRATIYETLSRIRDLR